MKPRVIDLFAGCGGFSHGFQKAGFEILGFVENWPPAVTTFLKNHPETVHLGEDITQIPDETFQKYRDKVEIIVGGPPCQGFSYCGKRDTNDKRNQLYKEYLRAIKLIQPEMAIMENVTGILTMKDSDNEKVINKIINNFIKLGYFVSYKVLKTSDYGIAQNRVRLILIAKKINLFPEPKKDKKGVIEAISNIKSDCNAHVYFNPKKKTLEKIRKLKQGERISKNYNFSRQRLFANKPSKTIPTKAIYIHPYEDRFLTPRELARLQSFPDDFHFTGSKTNVVKQIGNAVPPLLSYTIAEKIKEDLKNV
jgi:DNA (cytosine-5)-methyltransferase 1